MDLIEKIKSLKHEQLDVIIKARRAVPLASFLSINSKARTAAAQRHPGWQNELLKYTNASIEASVRTKINNAYSTATIMSAFESMGLAVISKLDLTLDEYDLLLSPVISAFPELVLLEQDWTPEPLEESQKYRPALPYNLPPVETRLPPTKKGRPFRRTEDIEEKVTEEVFDATSFMEALKPKTAPVQTKEEAIAAMLKAMASPKEIEPAPIFEAEVFKDLTPEDVGLEEEIPDVPLPPRILKITPTEGGFWIQDENGYTYGTVFKTAIDAIIYAAGQGLKLT